MFTIVFYSISPAKIQLFSENSKRLQGKMIYACSRFALSETACQCPKISSVLTEMLKSECPLRGESERLILALASDLRRLPIYLSLFLSFSAILTSDSITGTSTSTPTTVARAAPDCIPNREMATATANSKKLLAPIMPAGAATS